MPDKPPPARDIDAYIAGFPVDVQEVLRQVRSTIRRAAPDAEETISYAIPTFKLAGKYLVYFAGHRHHVGVYPVPAGDAELAAEMAPYQSGKGTLKFPLDRPIPFDLITKVVKFRAKENLERAEAKRRKQ